MSTEIPEDDECADCGRPLSNPADHCADTGWCVGICDCDEHTEDEHTEDDSDDEDSDDDSDDEQGGDR